jgi:hypothetical protein
LSSEGNKFIHVDFSIQTRDLFRANLGLAKIRLIVGLGFSLCLITGLVIFFLMIDEQLILLETSPLFVALPLVALGGQVLRLHALCRKYVSRLTESQRRMQYMFSADDDGYDVASGESFSHLSWDDVLKIIEKPTSFLIFLSPYDCQIIPKRGFHRAADIEVLRAIVRSSIGVKAKFLEAHTATTG